MATQGSGSGIWVPDCKVLITLTGICETEANTGIASVIAVSLPSLPTILRVRDSADQRVPIGKSHRRDFRSAKGVALATPPIFGTTRRARVLH
jgi:hypothetical protein